VYLVLQHMIADIIVLWLMILCLDTQIDIQGMKCLLSVPCFSLHDLAHKGVKENVELKVKVKLSQLFFLTEHDAMRTYGGVEV
jgi:hypothetical protein